MTRVEELLWVIAIAVVVLALIEIFRVVKHGL